MMTHDGRMYICIDEFGHQHAFLGSIGDELAFHGVIVLRDGKWRIRRADLDIVEQKFMGIAVCDFCSSRPVRFDVEARSFYNPRNMCQSVGGWAACEGCGVLIEKQDKDALLNRIVAHSLMGEAARSAFIYQQQLFWQNYISIKRIKPIPYGN